MERLRAAVGGVVLYRPRAGLIALLAAVLLAPSVWMAWRYRAMPQFGVMVDDGTLWVTAKALGEGHGYKLLFHPEQPWQTKYPPLYPVYLSLVWRLDPGYPGNLPLATLFTWLWTPPLLALAFLVFRQFGLDSKVSFLLTAALAVNPLTIYFSISLLSEVPYTCLLLAALLLLAKASKECTSAGWAVAAGILAQAAFLTRTAGFALLGAGVLWFLLRGQARRAVLFALGMLPGAAAWFWWMHTHAYRGHDLSAIYHTDYIRFYLETVRPVDLPLLVWGNLGGILIRGADLVLPTPGESAPERIFSIAVSVLAWIGVWRMIRRAGLHPYHLYAGGHILLLIPWNFPANGRLLFPLAPLLLAGFYEECRHIFQLGRQGLQRAAGPERAAGACFLAFLLALLGIGAWLWSRPLSEHFPQLSEGFAERRAGVQQAYRWIRENTPPEATFMVWQDSLLYLKTDRFAASPGLSPTPFYLSDQRKALEYYVEEAPRLAAAQRRRYLVVTTTEFLIGDSEELASARGILAANPLVREVYSSDDAAIYEVLPLAHGPRARPSRSRGGSDQ